MFGAFSSNPESRLPWGAAATNLHLASVQQYPAGVASDAARSTRVLLALRGCRPAGALPLGSTVVFSQQSGYSVMTSRGRR